jgi:hypothetical protein
MGEQDSYLMEQGERVAILNDLTECVEFIRHRALRRKDPEGFLKTLSKFIDDNMVP